MDHDAKSYSTDTHKVLQLRVALPDEVTEEEMETIRKYKLIPMESAFTAAEEMMRSDMKDVLRDYEQHRSKMERYSGLFFGVILSPLFVTLAIGLIGQSFLAFPLAAVMLCACWRLLDMAVNSTADTLREWKEKKNAKRFKEEHPEEAGDGDSSSDSDNSSD